MNFDVLTSKLKESAVKAASAARGFKGFDDMAANDEYIHTDDLNVVKRETAVAKVVEMMNKPRDSKKRAVNTMDSSSKLTKKPVFLSAPPSDAKGASVKLLDSVKDALNSSSHHQSVNGNESTGPLEKEDNESSGGFEDAEEMRANKRKNKNRFMEDLEQLTSKPVALTYEDEKLPLVAKPTATQKKGWLPWSQSEARSPSLPAPLSRSKPAVDREQNTEEEDFEITSSTAVLSQNEIDQLAQLRSGKFSFMVTFRVVFQDHSRETFVCVTLLLSAFAYLLRGHGGLLEDEIP